MGFSLINPMGLMFLTGFTVENASDEEVWVTPIGAVGERGERRPLPLSAFKIPYLLTPFRNDLPVARGARREFIYDWDDIQFSEILVRDAKGEYRALATGLHPTEGQYRRPQQTNFVVNPLDTLPSATGQQLAALEFSGARLWIFYGSAMGGLLFPWFVFRAARPPEAKPPPLPAP